MPTRQGYPSFTTLEGVKEYLSAYIMTVGHMSKCIITRKDNDWLGVKTTAYQVRIIEDTKE